MKTLVEIKNYCETAKSTATLRRVLPRMVEAFNNHSEIEKLHYAYHEDGAETWKHGWRESDYYPDEFDNKNQDIEKLFETTWLTGKKKSAPAFCKAQTFTAECAIFVFKISPANAEKRILKLKHGWETEFFRAKEIMEEDRVTRLNWEKATKETKDLVVALHNERKKIFGTYNSSTRRQEIETELNLLPKRPEKEYSNWITQANNCKTVAEYIAFKANELKQNLKE